MKRISVVITTYNHQLYLSYALDSVIMQKGNFELEIIIGDDASTDGTALILSEYAGKYPEIIKILSNSINIGVTKNILQCLQACTGDYIAFLEGDDYWMTTGKLQKQMEFLENNLDCAYCFNALELLFEEEGKATLHPAQAYLTGQNRSKLTVSEIIQDNFIGNFSCCMYRKSILDQLPADLFDLFVVDWMFNICCARMGDIGFISEVMSRYRIHGNSIWSGKSMEEKLLSWLKYASIYDRYLGYEYKNDFEVVKLRLLKELVKQTPKNITNAKKIKEYWRHAHLPIWKMAKLMR